MFDIFPHCEEHNKFETECDKCENGYYCLYDDKTKCVEMKNISLYYIASKEVCYEKCTDIFEKCINCTKDNCYKCEQSYFAHKNKECIKGIDNCVKHHYDETTKEKYCEQYEENYYCANNIKEVCTYIDPKDNNLYYQIDLVMIILVWKNAQKKYIFCLKCNNNK